MFYTDRQVAIMEFIQRYRQMRNVSPTLEEIARHFNVSKVTIHEHVRQLESKGALSREKHRARSLVVLDPDYRDESASVSTASAEATLPVTVLGAIAAGEPIEAVESPEVVDLADLIPMKREHYALRVRGNSMVDDGIFDNDLVIVERRNEADDGQVVVAILDDEGATLKRLYRERRNGSQCYRLQPANAAYEPIYVDRVEIRGVVVGVVRSM